MGITEIEIVHYVTNAFLPHKKDLKSCPAGQLWARSVSPFGPQINAPLVNIPAGEYVCAGPSSTTRKWYAEISVIGNGKVKVR
jgi:hypothetical protein